MHILTDVLSVFHTGSDYRLFVNGLFTNVLDGFAVRLSSQTFRQSDYAGALQILTDQHDVPVTGAGRPDVRFQRIHPRQR